MTRLVLGPLLRYVDETTATIWVETDAPCEVTVLGATSRTFAAHGHHYALVDVEGLPPGTSTPYTVTLDGETVWPPVGSSFPPSRVRTLDPSGPLRLAVGSCRRDGRHDPDTVARLGVDALRAYGQGLVEVEEASWPALLLLVGDQVYADSVPPAVRDVIAERRDPGQPPGWEVADFEEYTQLYRLSWSHPVVRWLLSTVPSMMILDDHDIRDDWNISRPWLEHMENHPWWPKRIIGALGAYWIYQHLGNLSPKERAADPLLTALTDDSGPPGDGGATIDGLARRADRERDGRWCYVHDLGRTRLIVLDSRGGRVLEPGEREMLGPRQLAWFDEQARGDVDHLVIVTSIPYLLPSGVHHLEAWNEALCDGAWGSYVASQSERLRQDFDLEHWASFQRSFRAIAGIVTEVAKGERGGPPASITFLSGDVHYSYLAQATEPTGGCPIHQVVTSPIRNALPFSLRLSCQVAALGVTGVLGGVLARAAGVHSTPLSWRMVRGSWFENALATLELRGRHSSVQWEAADAASPGSPAAMRTLSAAKLA